MRDVRRRMRLLAALLALLLAGADVAVAQVATTTVQDTVYSANGTPASGTVLLSWSAFTTAGGVAVPAGTMSVTIGTGGVLSVALAPNAGATPMGSYYTAEFHLSDGTTSRQYWVVPVTVPGGGPAKLAAIQNTVLPTSVAMQTVSKQYVDNAIAAAMTGYVAPSSSPFLLKAGDTMTGPLVLPADPVSALQAADKNYVDEKVGLLPAFGPSGTGHAQGLVPDPGATAGTTRFLREDGSWAVPAGGGSGGSGTMAAQNANAVAITGGSLDGVSAGATNPLTSVAVTKAGAAITVRSGSSGSIVAETFGRTSEDFGIGVTGGAGNFFSDVSAAGAAVFYGETAGIYFGILGAPSSAWTIDNSNKFHVNSLIANQAAVTAGSGQVAYGGTTVAPGAATCPSTGGVQGCVVINVAGTTRYLAYY